MCSCRALLFGQADIALKAEGGLSGKVNLAQHWTVEAPLQQRQNAANFDILLNSFELLAQALDM